MTKQQLFTELDKLQCRIDKLEENSNKQNIADTKLIFEVLKKREAQYIDLYDNAPDMFYSVKPDGTIISVNKFGAEYLGYLKEGLIGKPVWVVVYKDDLSKVRKRISEIINKKIERSELDFRKVRKDGSVINVHERTQLVFNNKGEIHEMRIICRDITDRKLAQEATKAEVEKYRTLTNNLNVGLFRSTPGTKGWFIEVNPALIKMFGYKNKEELFSINVSDLYMNPDDRAKFDKTIQKKGFVKNQELQLKKKNGTVFIGSVSTVVVKDKTGKAIYYDGIVEDITERKEAELAIREKEEQYRTLFNIAPGGIMLEDSNGTIIDANPAYCKTVGYEYDELIGKKVHILAHSESLARVDKNIKQILDGKILKHIEKSVRKDGSFSYMELRESRIILPDRKVGIICVADDITGRKIREEKLRRLSSVVEQSSEGLALTDLDGFVLFINNAFALMHGYTPKELLGKHLSIFHTHEQMPAVKAANQQIKESGSFSGEIWHVRKDGSVFPSLMQNTLFNDETGNPAGIIGTIRDITEIKKTEEDLKNSEESYKGLFNNATDAIYIQDTEGRFVDVNEGAVKMYGYPREYFIGKTPEFLSAPGKNNMEEIIKYVQKAFAGEPQRFEFWGIDKNGRVFPKEVRLNNGIYFGQEVVIAFAQDITERKKAEEEIRKLSRSVEQSPTIVEITNLDGNIEYVNPKFCEITGYSYDEVIGKNSRILKSGKTPEETYTTLWETITSGKEWHGEFRNMKKNGEIYWESAYIFPLKNDKGEITHFIAMKEDITARKKMEQDLINAKEKAEESDKLKSAFLANMSHEIRTPMNAIIGFSQLLSDYQLTEDEREHYISLIQNSGNDLLNLIDDIIDISKIEAGQLKVFKSQYFLDNILSEIYDSYNEFVKTKKDKTGLKLKYNKPDGGEKVVIYTDIDRFKQIIRNLISNAIKFTDFGLVEFGFSTDFNKKNPQIQFYVRDTGIGIPKEKLEIIFESFRQANISDTKIYGGTGLGLTITKKMVEILGGRIWVKSTPGQGSTFYFIIPYNPVNISAGYYDKNNKKTTSKIYNWKNKKILIVEDNDQSFLFFKSVLKKTQILMKRAISGNEAIELCKKNDFDLILMDIQLPEMDGCTATRQIKQFNKNVSIIAQTAYAMSDEKERCLEAGCDDYISKPVSVDNLLELINRYI